MARPTKKVNEKLLETLSMCHLPKTYIADVLGISIRSLDRRYGRKIESFRSKGKAKLVVKAMEMAEKGYWPAIKYLLGNHLGWSDKTTIEADVNSNSFTLSYSKESLEKKINEDK